MFLQAGIQGLPVITTLNLTVLLAALAALMLGNLVDLPAVAASAVALGLLQRGITWHFKTNPEMVEPILAVVIVVCLLVRKVGSTRADQDTSSSWNVSDEVRPVPARAAVAARGAGRALGRAAVLALAVALSLPLWLGVGDQLKAAAAVIFVIITMSVVVLTGWAGQVSLGQMSFAAFGAAVGAYATLHWDLDLGLSLLLAGLVGAAVAVVVGLPALRLKGFFLAVTTLAFALATSAYLLNVQHFSWVPDPNTRRSPTAPVRRDQPGFAAHLLLGVRRRAGAHRAWPCAGSAEAAPAGCCWPCGRTSGARRRTASTSCGPS